jgi:DNA-binding NarL/FixJ family response regulator
MRVLLVDDHPITRRGFRALIERELNLVICGEADSAVTAIELATSLKPDLAIVDITLPTTNGLQLTRQLKASVPEIRILVVSMHDEGHYAERALKAGAMGYLMKGEAGDHLGAAMQCLLRGELYLSARARERLPHLFAKSRKVNPGFAIDSLSNRELEVFGMIGSGLSTRQIAEQLGLSAKTIETYREHLKLKLGLADATELLKHAIYWVRLEG